MPDRPGRAATAAAQCRKRNMIARRSVAAAGGYVLAPELLGQLDLDARRIEDTFSAAYLLALTTQMQTKVGRAWHEAQTQGKCPASLCI